MSIDAAATATGMNGTGLLTGASVNDSLVYSGTGGITDTTNCKWENHAAASLPTIVFFQVYRPMNQVGHTVRSVNPTPRTTPRCSPPEPRTRIRRSGVDVALFRSSYDSNGIFSIEGARLMPPRDLSFKFLAGYAKSPLDLTVPGIGGGNVSVLNYVATFDMAFGMSLSEHVALGLDVGGYRTATGVGYGVRGRYASGGW